MDEVQYEVQCDKCGNYFYKEWICETCHSEEVDQYHDTMQRDMKERRERQNDPVRQKAFMDRLHQVVEDVHKECAQMGIGGWTFPKSKRRGKSRK